jgi:hypothetical protein
VSRVASLRLHYQASSLLPTRPSLRPALVLGSLRVYRLEVSLSIAAQVPTFRTKASRWPHAVFMPVAARSVGRRLPSSVPGQRLEPGFGNVPTLSTHQQRFTCVRLASAHLTGCPAFSATLTTLAIVPKQLAVVWTLILQSESEGPSLISCAARLLRFGLYIRASSPRRRGARRVAEESCTPPPSQNRT